MRNEELFVLVTIECEVGNDGSLQFVNRAGFVFLVIINEKRVFVLKILCKLASPCSKVILKVFGNILIVQREKDSTHQSQSFHARQELLLIIGMRFDRLSSLNEHGQKRLLKFAETVQDDLVELVTSSDVSKSLENRIRRHKNTIDHSHVGRVQLLNECIEKILPAIRKVCLSNQTDTLGDLSLDLRWYGTHELDDVALDSFSVGRGNFDSFTIFFVLRFVPSVLDHVLEMNRRSLANSRRRSIGVSNQTQDFETMLRSLHHFVQMRFGGLARFRLRLQGPFDDLDETHIDRLLI
mmetsp:Transcript_104070/g.301070  ORF Transcript_104070/g.301070 Transcript_104070/m.301070 type:complete len:295 (+) Transcript_104070:2057-2941(+)